MMTDYTVFNTKPYIDTYTPKINYKFNEGAILEEITNYVNKTYGQHYANEKFQAMEIIAETGDAVGFCRGNMLKYTLRLGKKNGFNRDDLLKVIHYSILLLHFSEDLQNKNKGS